MYHTKYRFNLCLSISQHFPLSQKHERFHNKPLCTMDLWLPKLLNMQLTTGMSIRSSIGKPGLSYHWKRGWIKAIRSHHSEHYIFVFTSVEKDFWVVIHSGSAKNHDWWQQCFRCDLSYWARGQGLFFFLSVFTWRHRYFL